MRLRTKFLLGSLVALAFATTAPSALAAAEIRVLHSAPDVPAVTVYVNGQAAVPSLAPLEATDYLELPAGTYQVAVAPAGQPESAAVLRTSLTLEDGKRYTGYATGLLADGSVRLGATEDAWRAPFARSSLRVWHNSPDAPAVDVIVNGQTALSSVTYGAISRYLPLPAGQYDVRINVAGTTTAVFDGQVRLVRGESYTAVAMGSVAGTGAPFGVQVLRDATSGALVRVLHAAPNVPGVTVYVNGRAVIQRAGTLRSSGYLALDPGTYNVAVSLAGRPASEAALRTRITVQDKTRYTALARGFLNGQGAQRLQLAVQRDIVAAPQGKASVRVWHLSPDAPRVDVLVNGRVVLSRVPYTRASSYLTLDPGTYRVGVRVSGTRAFVFQGRIAARANRASSATALGSVAGRGATFRVAVLNDA